MSITTLNSACSPLANMVPIGVGTARAESLDSYTQRLANAHRVPRYFIDLLVHGKTDSISRPKRPAAPGMLNTLTQPDFAQRLVNLTARPDVALIGFGGLKGSINRLGLCRSERAWCLECFGEWRAASVEPYIPHLWAIPSYKVCHIHRSPLSVKCNACWATFNNESSWAGSFDVCPKCKAPLHIEPGTIPSNGGYRKVLKDIPEYEELAAQVLAEFVQDVLRITTENLMVGVDFEMLMEHCRKYDLAHTQADLARVVQLSVTTIHELATGKFPPGLSNLVRIAVTCEVALVGLICPALWRTTASGSKIEGKTSELPVGNKRKFYDWDEIEKRVIASIESGDAKPPHTMAREMGLCEKQFCLKLGKTIYRLRLAAASKNLMERDREYAEIKLRLTEKIKFAKKNRKRTSGTAMSKSLGIGINNKSFHKAYDDLKPLLVKSPQR